MSDTMLPVSPLPADLFEAARPSLQLPTVWRRTLDSRDLIAADIAREQIDAGSLQRFVSQLGEASISTLGYLAGSIDKPFAAWRGLLAGRPEALWHAVPFSESFLKKPIERVFGVKIPEEHVTGREVLESFGAPKNEPGFNIRKNPMDAFWDAMGLAADLFLVPPYLPRIGVISSKGEKAFRMGKAAQPIIEMEAAIHNLGTRGQAAIVNALPKFEHGMVVDGVVQVAKEVGIDPKHIQVLKETIESSSPTTHGWLSERVLLAAQQKDIPTLTTLLDTLPETIRFYDVLLAGKPIMPAATWHGRAEELKQGLRAPLTLKPIWYWQELVPQIEITAGGQALGTAKDVIGDLWGVRHLRSMFHWGARNLPVGQAGAERAADQMRNLSGAASEIMLHTRGTLAAVEDHIAKYLQTAEWHGMAAPHFDQLAVYIAEQTRRWTSSADEQAIEIAKQLDIDPSTAPQLADALKTMTASINFLLDDILNKTRTIASSMGIPFSRRTSGLYAAYMPRYHWRTPAPSDPWRIPSTHTSGASGPYKGRLAALRYVPTSVLDLVSRDPALVSASRTGIQSQLSVVDSAGRFFQHGDWVKVGDHTGRIMAINGKRLAITAPHLPSGVVGVDVDQAVRAWHPANPLEHIEVERLSRKQQDDLIKEWLSHHGIKVDANAKPQWLRAKYVIERYWKAIDPNMHPMLEELLLLPPGKNNPKAIRQLIKDTGLTRNKRVAAQLTKTIQANNGLVGSLVSYLGKRRHERPIFSMDILANFQRAISSITDEMAVMGGIHEMLSRAAYWTDDALKDTGVPLGEAWNTLRFPLPVSRRTRGGAAAAAQMKKPIPGRQLTDAGFSSLLQNYVLKQHPDWANKLVITPTTIQMPLDTIDKHIRVPREIANTAQKFLDALIPETHERLWFEQVIRDFHSAFASWVTLPRLAFHVRNYSSDVLRGAIADAPYSTVDFLQEAGNVLKAAIKGEWETLPYWDEMSRSGLLYQSARVSDETLQTILPMRQQFGLREAGYKWPSIQTLKQQWLSAGGSLKQWLGKESPILQTGRHIMNIGEAASRAPIYISARKAGMTPAQAKDLVSKVAYDYSRLSGFEQRVMQPSLMFYSWLRQNLGYMMPRVILDYASGPSHLVRATGAAWRQAGEMPAWLEDTLAFPIPGAKDAEGNPVFVRSLGLPIEDIALFDPNLARLQSKIYARAHPAIKAAYMAATGEDPFTDRPIDAAPTLTERITGVELPKTARSITKIAETGVPWIPLTQYLRKAIAGEEPIALRALDAISGIKIRSTDVERQVLNERLDDAYRLLRSLPGIGEYRTVYAREGAPESSKRAAQLIHALQRLRQQETQKRKQAQQMQQPRYLSPWDLW